MSTTEDPTLLPVDPEWLRRFEAKSEDLMAERARRAAEREERAKEQR